jgi:hypothetical protein
MGRKEGGEVRFLHELIMSSRSYKQVRFFFPWFLSTPEQITMIREIGRNRRKRWLDRTTVPKQVFLVSREIGIILPNEKRKNGRNVLDYTGLLYDFIISGVGDDDKVELAKEIRKNTLDNEILPRVKKCKIKKSKYKYYVK